MPDSCEIDTWFICIISHYSQGSTLNFYPTCQFRQEIMIFPNFNFNCLIFYQNYFDKTFLPNSVINFSSIAFFFNDLKTSLNKKSLVQLDKRPSILTCPNFIFTGSRQVLMMSPDSVLSFCFHHFLLRGYFDDRKYLCAKIAFRMIKNQIFSLPIYHCRFQNTSKNEKSREILHFKWHEKKKFARSLSCFRMEKRWQNFPL